MPQGLKRSTERPPAKKVRNLAVIMGITLGFVSLMVGINFWYSWMLEIDQSWHIFSTEQNDNTRVISAYIHLGDGVPVTVLHSGQTYWTRVDLVRKKACETKYINRLIRDQDSMGYRIIHHLLESTQFYQEGEVKTDHIFQVPTILPPGNYEHNRSIISECGNTKYYLDNIHIPFKLEK